jgi:hypothetical protein
MMMMMMMIDEYKTKAKNWSHDDNYDEEYKTKAKNLSHEYDDYIEHKTKAKSLSRDDDDDDGDSDNVIRWSATRRNFQQRTYIFPLSENYRT